MGKKMVERFAKAFDYNKLYEFSVRSPMMKSMIDGYVVGENTKNEERNYDGVVYTLYENPNMFYEFGNAVSNQRLTDNERYQVAGDFMYKASVVNDVKEFLKYAPADDDKTGIELSFQERVRLLDGDKNYYDSLISDGIGNIRSFALVHLMSTIHGFKLPDGYVDMFEDDRKNEIINSTDKIKKNMASRLKSLEEIKALHPVADDEVKKEKVEEKVEEKAEEEAEVNKEPKEDVKEEVKELKQSVESEINSEEKEEVNAFSGPEEQEVEFLGESEKQEVLVNSINEDEGEEELDDRIKGLREEEQYYEDNPIEDDEFSLIKVDKEEYEREIAKNPNAYKGQNVAVVDRSLELTEREDISFSEEAQIGFGWRKISTWTDEERIRQGLSGEKTMSEALTKDKEGNFKRTSNLVVDDIKKQKFTTDMFVSTIKSAYSDNASVEESIDAMKIRRDNYFTYLTGRGDPSAAFDCVLDQKALKDGIYKFDYAKVNAFKNAMTDEKIKNNAEYLFKTGPVGYDLKESFRFHYGLTEQEAPNDMSIFEIQGKAIDLAENGNKFVHDISEDALINLGTELSNLQTRHESRPFWYRLRHPINWRRESNMIEQAKDILINDKYCTFDKYVVNKDQNVTPEMLEKAIEKDTRYFGNPEKSFAKMTELRDKYIDHLCGKGNPENAFKCMLKEDPENKGSFIIDQEKVNAFKEKLTDDKIKARTQELYKNGSADTSLLRDFQKGYGISSADAPNDPSVYDLHNRMIELRDSRRGHDLSQNTVDALAKSVVDLKKRIQDRPWWYSLRHPFESGKENRMVEQATDILVNDYHLDESKLEIQEEVQAENPVVEQPVNQPAVVKEPMENEIKNELNEKEIDNEPVLEVKEENLELDKK